jgi:hypothetical protein
MRVTTPRWSSRWRGVLVGTVIGALAGAGVASGHVIQHTAALWLHGMQMESNNFTGHPFLTSTDGTYRQASASYQDCPSAGGQHGPQAEYIHSHVHIFPGGKDHNVIEAHLGSQQTGLAHHEHHPC